MSQKLSRIVFLRMSSISNNHDIFWHKDGQDYKIMLGALIFHLT